jgi:transcriptional regulator with XRE-family HTH domain
VFSRLAGALAGYHGSLSNFFSAGVSHRSCFASFRYARRHAAHHRGVQGVQDMKSPNLKIGTHIRRLRLQQRRTQQDIAQACGFTKSLLCKIESNTVAPPAATLVKIARAMGTSVSALVESEPAGRTSLTKGADAAGSIVKTERGCWIYPFATDRKEKRMHPFLMAVRKGEVKEHRLAHDGEQFIYVLQGLMAVKVDKAEYRLAAGDSLYFNSSDEHQVIPVSDEALFLNFHVGESQT